MSECCVAVVQTCPGPDREANLATAGRLLESAAAQGADIIVLPELFGALVPAREWRSIAERAGGATEEFLAEAAVRHRCSIVGGSYIEKGEGDVLYNTCPVVGADGRVITRYRKMHLFWTDMPGETSYDERKYLEAGDRQTIFEMHGLRISVGICYDLRFPEFFRLPGGEPVDLYCLPAAFMEATGRAHWETLVRSRAIENLAYFAAAGTCGCHYEIPERPGEMVRTYGRSMVVSPWGEVLGKVDSVEGIATVRVTQAAILEARARLGALGHIRSELWRPAR